MPHVSANIHSINTENKTCLVSIKDGDSIICANKNIGLELNGDGTANTAWIQDTISTYVTTHRKFKNRSISVAVGD